MKNNQDALTLSSQSIKRYDWVDNLKFIGIFYIYLGHLGQAAGKLYPFVFSFHVPLFFFISGLFFTKTDSLHSLRKIITKSFVKIIVPYFIFSFIYLFYITIHYNLSTEAIYANIYKILQGTRNNLPAGSLWFLPCLFVVIIYYSLINFALKSMALCFSLSFVIYLICVKYNVAHTPKFFFNIDSALYYLAFYAFGASLSKTILSINLPEILTRYKKLSFIILLSSMLYTINVYLHGHSSIYKDIKMEVIRNGALFFGTIILFIPSVFLSCLIKSKAISTLGKSTLLLCGTEQLIKLMTMTLLGVFGIKVSFQTPDAAIIFTLFILSISYFTTVKIYNHLK